MMETRKRNLRFLVDVDDVLRDLVHNMVQLYNREFGTNMVYDDVKIYFTNVSFPLVVEKYGDAPHWFFQEHGHELFLESGPIVGAIDAVNSLKQYGTVQIVTKQRTTQNKIDTLLWLDKVGVKYDSISFVKNKSTVRCDFFIDDFHDNFIGCGSEGGTGVLINAPYNAQVDLEQLKAETGFDRIVRYGSLAEFVNNVEQYI
jgi:uncharacterized HAD superfamily protein